MRNFRVELGRNAHSVYVGAGLLDRLGEMALAAGLKPSRAGLITDSKVALLYSDRARASLRAAGFDAMLIEIPPGEASKSLETLGWVYDRMIEGELERENPVFALGGGVVGDLGAFAAATYLRGVALVQVPTTVAAQVDASLGGKTAVNHRHAKNLIGAFHQPRMIVADVATLKTLGDREFREGLAEVIKYGAIMDGPLIAELDRNLDAILTRDVQVLEEVVERSLRHKAEIVESDERESGLRRILNFGHTVGHALEAASGYGSYLHGEAVAIGMVAACRLSRAHAALGEQEAAQIEALIERVGLPVAMPPGWNASEFVRALRLDKKRTEEAIEFVLIDRLGHAFTRRLAFDEILAVLG
jgi:3-dehydroquinate synthase